MLLGHEAIRNVFFIVNQQQRFSQCSRQSQTALLLVHNINMALFVDNSVVTVAQSVAVFCFCMRPRCQWQISVGVKARVVNPKQVDVVALCSGCLAMC